jgi:hypothetical protein
LGRVRCRSLDYPELPTPIRCSRRRRDRLGCERRVRQFANRPNMIGKRRPRFIGSHGCLPSDTIHMLLEHCRQGVPRCGLTRRIVSLLVGLLRAPVWIPFLIKRRAYSDVRSFFHLRGRGHCAPRRCRRLANAGHNTRAIQDWLGHRPIQQTVRYTADAVQGFLARLKCLSDRVTRDGVTM